MNTQNRVNFFVFSGESVIHKDLSVSVEAQKFYNKAAQLIPCPETNPILRDYFFPVMSRWLDSDSQPANLKDSVINHRYNEFLVDIGAHSPDIFHK